MKHHGGGETKRTRGPVAGFPPCARCRKTVMYFYRREPGEAVEEPGRALTQAAYYLLDGYPIHAVCLTVEDREKLP